jgi:hypothetical protein
LGDILANVHDLHAKPPPAGYTGEHDDRAGTENHPQDRLDKRLGALGVAGEEEAAPPKTAMSGELRSPPTQVETSTFRPSRSSKALSGDHAPDCLDHPEWPSSREKAIDAGKQATERNAKMNIRPRRSRPYITIMKLRATTP